MRHANKKKYRMGENMKSIWHDESLRTFPKLMGDKKTDVLIIGGGLAGILTAYYLQQQSVDYILVEKNRICAGITQNTTAKITAQHGLIYHKILKKRGPEIARKYLEANLDACREYEKLCQSGSFDYEKKNNFVYSTRDKRILEAELGALSSIGYFAKLSTDLLLPISTVGAVEFSEQAQFHPVKFISSIIAELTIYERTFVQEVVGKTAITDCGKIYADKVVVATHFPFINKHGSYFLKMYQHRSYVIALKNATGMNGMFVDENRTGYSFREYEDYLLLGGGGHRTGKRSEAWEQLRRFARENYPEAKEIYTWAAQDCVTLDDIPYIGNYSASKKNWYVETGFNKWGMTSSMVAARIIVDLLLEKKNPYAEVFNPSRNMISSQLFINMGEATKNLLTFTGKRCPHLGCSLKWNPKEQSWDCPCHGSRFTVEGEVLDNPANRK